MAPAIIRRLAIALTSQHRRRSLQRGGSMRVPAFGVVRVVVLMLLFCTTLFSQRKQFVALHEILLAHKALPAWTTAPVSIQITGVSTRGRTAEPVKITATRYEEVLIDYG